MLRKRVWLREGLFVPMWVALCVDALLCAGGFYLTHLICSIYAQEPMAPEVFRISIVAYMLFTALSFMVLHNYVNSLRRVTDQDLLRLFSAIFIANFMLGIFYITGINKIFPSIEHQPGTIYPLTLLLNSLLSILLVVCLRMLIRFGYRYSYNRGRQVKKSVPLLIYEVDPKNRSVSAIIGHTQRIPYRLIGYVTQDADAAGKMLNKIPIYHDDGDMELILNRTGAGALLIDPHCLSQFAKQKLTEVCQKQGVILLCVPSVEKWKRLDDQNPISRVRKVQIEDLLVRTSVCTDTSSLERSLKGKCLLVTGAAGSIGSEISRQILNFDPSHIILCDMAETPLYQLWLELQERYPDRKIIPLLADVRNKMLMDILFDKFRPQVVFHAAAYKHVTMMEQMPCQSVTTNIMGTMNLADIAAKHNVEVFVMISSDKAVNPTNVMGASKRIAEIYVQSLSQKLNGSDTTTRFITTRFGNVLGSNGSVVPIFEQQIEQGGPVTVTHPDVFRYFMTIPEACGLVLEAANIGKNGEVFVLDMGEPVKIRELAENMIRLSGYEPYKEIDIIFTGLRPGEKLSEELLYDQETVAPTCHPKILIGRVQKYDYDQIVPQLEKLIDLAVNGERMEVVRQMKTIVPEFVSNNSNFEDLFPVPDGDARQSEPVALEAQTSYA